MTFMKGSRCELRVLKAEDAFTFTRAVNAGLTTEHLFTGSIPMRDADYAARWEAERKAGDILFAVDADGKFIGTCGLHSHRDIYRSWEARFLIFDPEVVGKGIGKEVVKMLTDYCFNRLNSNKCWLGCSADNLRAVKCYLDCGYRLEGTLRQEIYYRGRYHDALRMSVLRSEWEDLQRMQKEVAAEELLQEQMRQAQLLQGMCQEERQGIQKKIDGDVSK